MRKRSISVLSEQVAHLANQNERLKEELKDVRLMFDVEDRFWIRLGAWMTGEHLEGFDLDELQDISARIRPHVVGDSLTAQGCRVHQSYVWARGINIDGVSAEGGKRRTALQRFYSDPVNQESLFGESAKGVLQKARYAEGNLFLACNSKTKQARVIPFGEISGLKVNPDFPTEVWAYQRTWHPDGSLGKARKRWYYTNVYKGDVKGSLTQNKETVPVDPDIRVIDRRFNRLPGFVLGVPDSIGMHVWVAAYNEVMEYGRVVNESLARILFKVTNSTKKGAQHTGAIIDSFGGHGGTASMGPGQELTAVSTAGKGYEFTNARPLSAMAAASIGISNIELLADSSAAGSSYGASQSLAPSVQKYMKTMQREWEELFTEVLDFFGVPTKVWFDEIIEPDTYRAAQTLTLLSPTLWDEEYRQAALDILNLAGTASKIPPTLASRMVPNAAAQQAAPDQGRSNGTNSAGSGANDLRSDTIEFVRREMAIDEKLRFLEDALARLEDKPDSVE